MFLDIPMWKKNFKNPYIVIGLIIGFIGVAMLYIEQFNNTNENNQSIYGVLLLILGCISWALGTLYTKYRSSKEEDINSMAGSAWQMLFAGILFWICSTINGEVSTTNLNNVSTTSWLSLIYLIFFGSILAYSAYIWLLKVRSATEVATHAYVNPFVAVFLGVTFGQENVTWIQLLGLIVILFSVMMISRKKYQNKIVNN